VRCWRRGDKREEHARIEKIIANLVSIFQRARDEFLLTLRPIALSAPEKLVWSSKKENSIGRNEGGVMYIELFVARGAIPEICHSSRSSSKSH